MFILLCFNAILLCFVLLMQIELINFAEVEIASQITLLDRGMRLPDTQQKETYHRIHSHLKRALRAMTCCSRDDVNASSSHASAPMYTPGASTSAAPHAASSRTAASSSCKSFIIVISINIRLFERFQLFLQ